MKEIKTRRKITLQEIGVYIKVIKLDFNPKDNKELAELISDTFNLICKEKDIDDYERLHIVNNQIEDYELENRKQEYGINFE